MASDTYLSVLPFSPPLSSCVVSKEVEDKENDTLRELIKKINHPLVSIRSRALKSIKFKLTNQIVTLPQLVHERSLLIHLLEWFNFTEWNHEDTVLNLLKDLSNYEAASETIQEVGGVEFLSQLRPHLRSSSQETIDEILENLLHLPPSFGTNSNNKATPSTDLTHSHSTSYLTITPPVLTTPINSTQNTNTTNQNSTNNTSHKECLDKDALPWKLSLPWIPLSRVDQRVLLSTLTRLKETSCTEVTWKFFDEVLLTDFPPQVFLQRPSLIKYLFDTLTNSTQSTTPTTLLPLTTLLSLSTKLLNTYHSISSSSSRQPCLNIETPSLTTNSYYYYLTEDIEKEERKCSSHLFSQQMEPLTFTSSSLSIVTSLLLTSFDKYLPWLNDSCRRHGDDGCHGDDGNRSDSRGFVKVFRVCLECISVLSKLLVELVKGCGQDMNEKVCQCTDDMCIVITQCLSKLRRARESGVIPYSLLLYLCPLTTVLSHWFVQLFECIMKNNKNYEKVFLSSHVSSLLKELYIDPFMNFTLMNSKVLQNIDEGFHKVLQTEQAFVASFNQLHYFMSLFTPTSDSLTPPTNSAHLVLDTAEKCVLGLGFNWSKREAEFVKLTVQECVSFTLKEETRKVGGKDSITERCHQLLVTLTRPVMRNEVIIATCDHLMKKANGHLSTVLCPFFVTQLCYYHLLSSHLSSITGSLLSLLVKELNKRNNWTTFEGTLFDALPYLECSAAQNIKMLNLVYDIINHAPFHIRVCSMLRMMYSEINEIREKSIRVIIDQFNIIMKREGKQSRCTNDILIMSSPPLSSTTLLRGLYVPSVNNSSSFKVEDINKLLSVVSSHTMETTLKGSALEQLSAILHDCTLHETAIKGGLLTYIHAILTKQHVGDHLLSPSLKCLQLLILGSDHVRKTLINDESFMIDLLKVSLYEHVSTDIKCYISQIIALLVYTDVLQFEMIKEKEKGGEGMKIDEQIMKHIKLPFTAEPLPPTLFNNLPPTQFNNLPPTHLTSLPPTHSHSSLLSSPPTRKRLWLQYMMARVGGSIDRVPYENQSKGPILNTPYFIKDKGDMNDEEKRNVIFNTQCLLYIDPQVRLKWSLYELRKGKESLLLDDSRIVDKMELLRTCLSLLSSLSLFYCDDYNNERSLEFTEDNEKEKIEETTTKCMKGNQEKREDEMKREKDGQKLSLFDDIKSTFITYFSSSLNCKSITSNNQLLPSILDCLRNLMTTCVSTNLIGRKEFVDWINEVLFKDGCCIRLLKDNNDREVIKALLVFLSSLSNINVSFHVQLITSLYDIIMTSSDNHILYLTLYCLWRINTTTYYNNTMSSSSKVLGIELTEVYMKLIDSLKKVIWGVVTNRGTSFGSFISKGITRLGVMNIDLIMSVIIRQLNNKEFDFLNDDCTLLWVHSLIHDRDMMVSSSIYSILSSLCSLSLPTLMESWSELHTYGLLGAMIDTGLDSNCTPWIRYQALTVAVSVLYRLIHTHSLKDSVKTTCTPVKETHDNDKENAEEKEEGEKENKCNQTDLLLFIKQEINSFIKSLTQSLSHLISLLSPTSSSPLSSVSVLVVVNEQMLIVSGLCQLVTTVVWSLQENTIDLEERNITGLLQLINRLLLSNDGVPLDHTHSNVLMWIELYTRSVALLHAINKDYKSCDHSNRSHDQSHDSIKGSRDKNQSHDSINKSHDQSKGSCDQSCDYHREVDISISSCFQLLNLRKIHQHQQGISCKVDLLCNEIISYLRSFITEEKGREKVASVLMENWSLFTSIIVCTVRKNIKYDLSINCLSLFSSTLSQSIASLSLHAIDSHELCIVLMEKWESGGNNAAAGSNEMRELIWNSLTLLLTCSEPAKDTVVKEGLLESLNERLQTLHCKLTMNPKGLTSTATHNRKVVSNDVKEIVKCLRLLQNILHGKEKHKCTAIKSGLLQTLNTLWPLTVTNRILLKPYLQLLATLTANCTEAHIALTIETKPGSCLLQQIIKTTTLSLLSKSTDHLAGSLSFSFPSYIGVTVELFTVLCNCAVTQECRTLMKKTNFFSLFLQINPRQDFKGGVATYTVVSEWLKLLVNITFNGQSILNKLNDMVDLLVDIWGHLKRRRDDQLNCVTIFRNLSFYGPAKPLLATHEGVLDIFTHCLNSRDDTLILLSSIAIGALVDNCTKLKVLLRKKSLHLTLIKTTSELKLQDKPVPQAVTTVIKMLQ